MDEEKSLTYSMVQEISLSPNTHFPAQLYRHRFLVMRHIISYLKLTFYNNIIMAKYSEKAQDRVHKSLHEEKEGTLKAVQR